MEELSNVENHMGPSMAQMDDDQTRYDRQAEFGHEKQHLGDVVDSIDTEIHSRENRGIVIEGDTKTADKVKGLGEETLENIRNTRSKPYFGRIDYTTDQPGGVRSIYIGEINMNSNNPKYFVASRNAPIARLYYRPTDGFYEVRDRRLNASVELKRTLQIEDAQLLDFDDVLRLPSTQGAPALTSSAILDDKLSSPADEQLSDAVETIQPEQYEQIASTQKPVLIVQGAAGSGKSLVGLHRIDFILSPFSDIGGLNRPQANRVIMFGPSPAFLEYVSKLLPDLGVQRVRQTTVSQWLLDQFSSRVTLSSDDRVFDDLMNNRRNLTQSETEAQLFKGGLKMKRLVDNYASHLTREIQMRVKQTSRVRIPSNPPMDLSASEFGSRVEDAFKVHQEPNVARKYFIDNLAEQWTRSHLRRDMPQYQVAAETRRAIEVSLDIWPALDFRSEYVKLMSNPNMIMRYSGGSDVDQSKADEISRTAPSGAGQALGMTDLAAALYLDYIINGFQSERFQHVVVDEAQDISPLEIYLMKMHSENDTFTILGDLRQSILPYKSISNWHQLASLFERENVSRLDSRVTYRSTRQITQYANRILQGLPDRTKMPIPYDRRGERPTLMRSSSAAEMRRSIAGSLRRLRRLDNVRSISVLTKWRQTARDISKTLSDEGIEDVREFTKYDLLDTDIIISPIILTKGLEFDAVIVANAHKDNFKESEFDRMLLYLACSRARHHLEIHWYGVRSPIVPDVTRLAR